MEGAKKGSKLSVERVYQKKTQLEHILLRPDTYIGSVEPITQVGPRRLPPAGYRTTCSTTSLAFYKEGFKLIFVSGVYRITIFILIFFLKLSAKMILSPGENLFG